MTSTKPRSSSTGTGSPGLQVPMKSFLAGCSTFCQTVSGLPYQRQGWQSFVLFLCTGAGPSLEQFGYHDNRAGSQVGSHSEADRITSWESDSVFRRTSITFSGDGLGTKTLKHWTSTKLHESGSEKKSSLQHDGCVCVCVTRKCKWSSGPTQAQQGPTIKIFVGVGVTVFFPTRRCFSHMSATSGVHTCTHVD